MPWIPLGVAGALLAVAEAGQRRFALLLLFPATASTLVMLAYIDLLPSGLWLHTNIHYFKWLTPMLGLFTWLFISHARRRPFGSLAALLPILLITSLRYEAVRVVPEAPARLITFAAPRAPFAEVYFARSVVTDRSGTLRNVFDYHQVPDGKGLLLAEALRRDFSGGEMLVHPGAGVTWPTMPPGPDLQDRFTSAPVARYRAQLSLGWPCWLPPYACPTMLR